MDRIKSELLNPGLFGVGWSDRLGLLVELFERAAIFSFPCDEPICATTVYNCRRCRWTGELGIFCEDQKAFFLGEHPFSNELLALSHDIGILLHRWTLFQYSRGAAKDDKTIWSALASPLGTFYTAMKHASTLGCCVGLGDRGEDVGTEDGKKLTNARA